MAQNRQDLVLRYTKIKPNGVSSPPEYNLYVNMLIINFFKSVNHVTSALLGKLQSSIAAEKIVFSVDKLVTPNYLLFISVRLMDLLFYIWGRGILDSK